MSEELQKYIAQAKEKRVPENQLKAILIASGWPEAEVTHALSQSSVDLLPPPVPHVGMWTGFLYILFFICLYVFATSLSGIFHFWVEELVPNNNGTSSFLFFDFYSEDTVRGYISSIIVSFPIFAFLAIMLKRQLLRQPFVANIRSRKILIYTTLIVTFIILIWNLSSTIYSYLAGNLTSNVIGHFVVTLLIAGGIFAYYINEVKNDRKKLL